MKIPLPELHVLHGNNLFKYQTGRCCFIVLSMSSFLVDGFAPTDKKIPWLPDNCNRVLLKRGVHRYNGPTFNLALGHQHPVEGVTVRAGECARSQGMFHGNRQNIHASLSQQRRQIIGGFSGVGQFSQPIFGSDFPAGGATDQNCMLGILDDVKSSCGKP